MNGALSKAEFRGILQSQSAVEKLERVGIKASLLQGLFEVLDHDGSDDISEQELLDGFQQLCTRFSTVHGNTLHIPAKKSMVGVIVGPRNRIETELYRLAVSCCWDVV